MVVAMLMVVIAAWSMLMRLIVWLFVMLMMAVVMFATWTMFMMSLFLMPIILLVLMIIFVLSFFILFILAEGVEDILIEIRDRLLNEAYLCPG